MTLSKVRAMGSVYVDESRLTLGVSPLVFVSAIIISGTEIGDTLSQACIHLALSWLEQAPTVLAARRAQRDKDTLIQSFSHSVKI